jgi:hypothetical protein
MLFAIADARLRRVVILSVMLVAGCLSNPFYRARTHITRSFITSLFSLPAFSLLTYI